MADLQLSPPDINFPNAQKTMTAGANLTAPTDFNSLNSMRTALAAVNGTYYTPARLDSMTSNDMVYALRVHKDPGTIS